MPSAVSRPALPGASAYSPSAQRDKLHRRNKMGNENSGTTVHHVKPVLQNRSRDFPDGLIFGRSLATFRVKKWKTGFVLQFLFLHWTNSHKKNWKRPMNTSGRPFLPLRKTRPCLLPRRKSDVLWMDCSTSGFIAVPRHGATSTTPFARPAI